MFLRSEKWEYFEAILNVQKNIVCDPVYWHFNELLVKINESSWFIQQTSSAIVWF